MPAWKNGAYSKPAKTERLLAKLLLKNASSVRKLFFVFVFGQSFILNITVFALS